jgi:hypothetical protein
VPSETTVPSPYDFLPPEDRRWIGRCRILAAILFLGLFVGGGLTAIDVQHTTLAANQVVKPAPAADAAP